MRFVPPTKASLGSVHAQNRLTLYKLTWVVSPALSDWHAKWTA
jgi:hypothetical protein